MPRRETFFFFLNKQKKIHSLFNVFAKLRMENRELLYERNFIINLISDICKIFFI
mgnify:CR=1 FL=1